MSLLKGHTTAEIGIKPRPLAQESETLPLGHRDLLMYMGVAVSFTKQRIAIPICKADDHGTATDAIEDCYFVLAYLLILTAQLS